MEINTPDYRGGGAKLPTKQKIQGVLYSNENILSYFTRYFVVAKNVEICANVDFASPLSTFSLEFRDAEKIPFSAINSQNCRKIKTNTFTYTQLSVHITPT